MQQQKFKDWLEWKWNWIYGKKNWKNRKKIGNTKTSINERISVSLRSNIKKLQDRLSELKTRPKGEVESELKIINEKLGHYQNVLIKQKPGPKKIIIKCLKFLSDLIVFILGSSVHCNPTTKFI